jgi:hypothetical protein
MCIEKILGSSKVCAYIDWQEKNPQMMIILRIFVNQHFTPEAQAFININNFMMVENPNKLQDLNRIKKKIQNSEMMDDDQ